MIVQVLGGMLQSWKYEPNSCAGFFISFYSFYPKIEVSKKVRVYTKLFKKPGFLRSWKISSKVEFLPKTRRSPGQEFHSSPYTKWYGRIECGNWELHEGTGVRKIFLQLIFSVGCVKILDGIHTLLKFLIASNYFPNFSRGDSVSIIGMVCDTCPKWWQTLYEWNQYHKKIWFLSQFPLLILLYLFDAAVCDQKSDWMRIMFRLWLQKTSFWTCLCIWGIHDFTYEVWPINFEPERVVWCVEWFKTIWKSLTRSLHWIVYEIQLITHLTISYAMLQNYWKNTTYPLQSRTCPFDFWLFPALKLKP